MAKTKTRFCDRPALERFFALEGIYSSAEKMVDVKGRGLVDETIKGIEDWCKSEGVPEALGEGYDHFIEGLKKRAQERPDPERQSGDGHGGPALAGNPSAP